MSPIIFFLGLDGVSGRLSQGQDINIGIQRVNRFGHLRVLQEEEYMVCKNSEGEGNLVCVEEKLTDYSTKRRNVKETKAGESEPTDACA